MIDRIHHIAVVVKSVDAAFGFFRDVMGLQVTADRVIEDQGVRAALLAVGCRRLGVRVYSTASGFAAIRVIRGPAVPQTSPSPSS